MTEILTFVLESDFVMDLCHCTATGIAQKTVGLNSIRRFLVPLPPYGEQQRIVDAISLVFSQIGILEKEKTDLQSIIIQAKSKILDLGIRGKIVSQDPNDEPASVLPESIRAEKEVLIKQGKLKHEKKESFIFRGDDKSYYEQSGICKVNIDNLLEFSIPESWTCANCHLHGICCLGETYPQQSTMILEMESPISQGQVILRMDN